MIQPAKADVFPLPSDSDNKIGRQARGSGVDGAAARSRRQQHWHRQQLMDLHKTTDRRRRWNVCAMHPWLADQSAGRPAGHHWTIAARSVDGQTPGCGPPRLADRWRLSISESFHLLLAVEVECPWSSASAAGALLHHRLTVISCSSRDESH